MSLFGALMGDVDEDPFIGSDLKMERRRNHIRRMNSIMNSFMRDPFADMMGGPMGGLGMLAPPPMATGRQGDHRQMALARHGGHQDAFGSLGMMPMGFPMMGNLFQQVAQNPGNCLFSSSTVMTMTQGPDGRPQVYQASTSTRQGPGGIKETKKTVADSRTGVKKMAIGHHIGERAHVIEREQNVYSGEKEERQELINLDEDEADEFNREWEKRTKPSGMRQQALSYGHPRQRHHEPQLALPSSSPQAHQGHLKYSQTPRSSGRSHLTSGRVSRETSKSGQKRKSQSLLQEDTLDQPKNKKTLIEPTEIVLDDDDDDDDDDVEEEVVEEEEISSGEESD